MPPSTPPAPAELRRTMRVRHLVGSGLVFIGPAAAVGILGPLDARSHGATAAVYVVATVVMALTAFAYARMSRVVPSAGSVYAYAREGIGPRTGFVAGWMVLLDYLLVPSVAFLFVGLALHSAFAAVPAWAFTAVAVVVAVGFNLAGAATLARAAIVVVAVEVVVLGAVMIGAVAVLARGGAHRPALSPLVGIGGFAPLGVIGAVSVAALAFLGFDAIATFAEENAGSARLIGRATVACLLVAGVLFVAQSYIVELLVPWSPSHLSEHPELRDALYYDTVRQQVTPWLATALSLAKAVGAAFSGMVSLAAGGRVVMAMARDGRMPKAFARASARTSVPAAAVGAATAVTLVLAVWAAATPGGLDVLASTVSIGALSAFVLLHAAVIGYHRRAPRLVPDLLIPVAGIACLVPVIVLADRNAQIVGAAWLAVGLAVLAVLTLRRRAA
jgi:amino acid transporter